MMMMMNMMKIAIMFLMMMMMIMIYSDIGFVNDDVDDPILFIYYYFYLLFYIYLSIHNLNSVGLVKKDGPSQIYLPTSNCFFIYVNSWIFIMISLTYVKLSQRERFHLMMAINYWLDLLQALIKLMRLMVMNMILIKMMNTLDFIIIKEGTIVEVFLL